MSKAVGWIKARTKKRFSSKDKLSAENSPSNSPEREIHSKRNQSDYWKKPEPDPDPRPTEFESPYGSPYRSPYGSSRYNKDWRDGPIENPDSRSSTSTTITDVSSSNEADRSPFHRRSVTVGQAGGIPSAGRRRSADLRSQSPEANQQQSYTSSPTHQSNASSPIHSISSRFYELELDTAKVDSLLLNWPKLKSTYAMDNHRFEGRLLRLMEVETEIIVVGEEPTPERWSLGLIDDGVKALGKAIARRGYAKLKLLHLEQCRMLFESSFATLARAINATSLPNLEELSFEHISGVNNQGVFELAKAFKTGGHFSRLTALILIDNGMQDEGLITLAREGFGSGNLSSLKKLHIGSSQSDGKKANYEEFYLDGAREFALEVSSSGHLPQLEDLRFSGCVHWKGVASVIEALETRINGAVKRLDLSGSPLGIEGTRVLARALEAPQFSSLESLNLDIAVEAMHIILEAFQLKNLYGLQRVTFSNVRLGEEELLSLAALLEGNHLPGLVEFSAYCSEITITSALALVRAYESNESVVARLNIGKWPMELQAEYEKLRKSNLELDELI
ncbi:hypothetical protein R1sor_013350 [Riccia sorocarpa]|uniref:Uncharacterized protein n=1 Tax=Riccia sorocarpa TaxID=122646 RepID=A0ABD3HAD7_9MARC